MKIRANTDGTDRAVFLAGPNPHGLRRFPKVVRGVRGVSSGAGFKLQRREALFGLCFHFEAFLRVFRC